MDQQAAYIALYLFISEPWRWPRTWNRINKMQSRLDQQNKRGVRRWKKSKIKAANYKETPSKRGGRFLK